jgi:SAM-dependent methyltransferase
MLRRTISHPLTRGLDLDDPRTTRRRRRILDRKPFLRRIYEEWYAALAEVVPGGEGRVLELGSGAGFLERVVPGLIRSEVLPMDNVSLILDGRALPFTEASLKAVVMTNVFHHVARVRAMLAETARCVRPGGVMAMIEPWRSRWSDWVYRRLHHEPFEPDAPEWDFPARGPLSGANGALAWIVFERDRDRFEREYPQWRIASVEAGMPLRYLISGGMAYRAFSPGWSFETWRWVEKRSGLGPMFARIVLVRSELPEPGGDRC